MVETEAGSDPSPALKLRKGFSGICGAGFGIVEKLILSRSHFMVINMAAGATEAQLQHVIDRIVECGFQPHVTRGSERAIVAAVGSGGSRVALEALQAAPGVEDVVPIAHPFKLVSKIVKSGRTQVDVGGVIIGGEDAVVIAGPCSVESRE